MTTLDYIAVAVVALWVIFMALLVVLFPWIDRWHQRWAWQKAERIVREEMRRRGDRFELKEKQRPEEKKP